MSSGTDYVTTDSCRTCWECGTVHWRKQSCPPGIVNLDRIRQQPAEDRHLALNALRRCVEDLLSSKHVPGVQKAIDVLMAAGRALVELEGEGR